jgi:hypothetical protein
MKSWILFLLGTIAYFIIRYEGRTDKTKELDIKFWIRDNWVQLSGAFILDLIAMLLIMDPDIDISGWLIKFIPEGLVSLAVLAIPAACGLGLGWGAYEFIKLFLKKKADNSLIAKNDKP